MKNICLILVATILATASVAQPCSQGPCPIVGTPHVDGGPVFTIDRYLGRAVNMTSISDRRARINTGNTDNLYCSDIQLAVDLRASYLRRVVGTFGSDSCKAIGSPYMNAAQQNINDILQAFDCAGLERPIIEAGIYEWVDTTVNQVPIPPYVLNEFQNDAAFWAAGYTTSGNYNFDIANILYVTPPPPSVIDPSIVGYIPDISRITTKMWFFYQATQFINMGTLSTHAGWLYLYTRNDLQSNNEYSHTNDVFQRIRNYGTIYHPQHFHVINADFCVDYPVCSDVYVGNPANKQLLLDFNSAALAPGVANHPQNMSDSKCFNNRGFTSGTGDNLYTEQAFHTYLQQVYRGSSGGTSPMGNTYDKTPTLFSLDWIVNHCTEDGPFTTSQNHHLWDCDQVTWFERLDDACQAYWYMNAMYGIQNDIIYRGYLSAPLLVYNLRLDTEPTWAPTYNFKQFYSPMRPISVNPVNQVNNANSEMYNGIKDETWGLNEYFSYTITPVCKFDCQANCSTKVYKCRVTDAPGSSVYQWHVQNLNTGMWLAVTYGPERILEGLPAGTYQITCVENNFGLNGQVAKSLEKELEIDGSTECIISGGQGGSGG